MIDRLVPMRLLRQSPGRGERGVYLAVIGVLTLCLLAVMAASYGMAQYEARYIATLTAQSDRLRGELTEARSEGQDYRTGRERLDALRRRLLEREIQRRVHAEWRLGEYERLRPDLRLRVLPRPLPAGTFPEVEWNGVVYASGGH